MIIDREDLKLKSKLLNLFKTVNPLVSTKITNLQSKTSQYSVPDELFQNRTALYSRVLLPWKSIYNNNLTIEHLKTFYGGVCVEFINYDFINSDYESNETYKYLKKKLGSDDKTLPRLQRKQRQIDHAKEISEGAALIKLGDKISNVTDITDTPPTNWDSNRRLEYFDWAEKVISNCPKVNEKLENYFKDIIQKGRGKLQ